MKTNLLLTWSCFLETTRTVAQRNDIACLRRSEKACSQTALIQSTDDWNYGTECVLGISLVLFGDSANQYRLVS